MNLENNYYKILGLEPNMDRTDKNFNSKRIEIISNVTESDIKNAYRDMSKLHHPDKGGNINDFKMIKEAYKILSNNRDEYDSKSRYGVNYDFSNELYDFEFSNMSVATDIYSEQVKRFKENEMIDLLVAIDNYIPSITYDRKISCDKCNGYGYDFDQPEWFFECDLCEGCGEFEGEVCYTCKGHGSTSVFNCTYCNGKKTINIKQDIELDHSKFENGILKVDFMGNDSTDGSGKKGNLYVKIRSEYKEKGED